MDATPKDPAMLLSFVNLKLRDYYSSLEELCAALSLDREELCRTLANAEYEYDPRTNQFV
ncbi:MAG: DUF4250 domain-containing protein [Lachnospiraceae bacterium]|nr:DUF4250 domain-containing protein [Lachnospiraceae bacterium]